MPEQDAITVAILAGGKSTRMGQDKSGLLLHGKPLLSHVIERVREFGDDLLLVTNTPERHAQYGLPMHPDFQPGGGPLVGIYTALLHSQTDYTLIVGCDMPYLDPALLRFLIGSAPGFDAVVPELGGRLQGLHAVYGKSCMPSIEHHLNKGELAVFKVLKGLNVRTIAETELAQFDLRSFENLNTPDDFQRASQS